MAKKKWAIDYPHKGLAGRQTCCLRCLDAFKKQSREFRNLSGAETTMLFPKPSASVEIPLLTEAEVKSAKVRKIRAMFEPRLHDTLTCVDCERRFNARDLGAHRVECIEEQKARIRDNPRPLRREDDPGLDTMPLVDDLDTSGCLDFQLSSIYNLKR